MQIDITVSRPDPLDPAKFHTAIVTGMKMITLAVLRRAMVNVSGRIVRVQTGRLRSSLQAKLEDSGDAVTATVGTNVVYAQALEFGSRPHLILPRQKKALRWVDTVIRGAKDVQTRRGLVKAGGRIVRTDVHFAKVVHHPGNKPMPFLQTAVAETLPEVPSILLNEITKALGGDAPPAGGGA